MTEREVAQERRIPEESELGTDVPTAARLLGVSRSTGYRHLPTVQIGRRRIVLWSALRRLLAEERPLEK
jgi:hypothetical protein